jgi:hypothetical protein
MIHISRLGLLGGLWGGLPLGGLLCLAVFTSGDSEVVRRCTDQ